MSTQPFFCSDIGNGKMRLQIGDWSAECKALAPADDAFWFLLSTDGEVLRAVYRAAKKAGAPEDVLRTIYPQKENS